MRKLSRNRGPSEFSTLVLLCFRKNIFMVLAPLARLPFAVEVSRSQLRFPSAFPQAASYRYPGLDPAPVAVAAGPGCRWRQIEHAERSLRTAGLRRKTYR